MTTEGRKVTTKSAFDYSGPSIWTRDSELVYINNGKINGAKRREQIRHTETFGLHPLQSKKTPTKSKGIK
jgi:hypothetical protein